MQVESDAHRADVAELNAGADFSPARALEAVADRWSLLIFREALFNGTTRSIDFARILQVPTAALTERLAEFVEAGLLEGVVPKSGAPSEYRVTNHGRNLMPVVVALTSWTDGWIDDLAIDTNSDGVELLIEFSLLGSFAVRIGGATIEDLAVGSQRLLVFLALHDRAVARTVMAQTMWPEAEGDKAAISLRSALSRLDSSTRDAILSASAGLRIAAAVSIDYRDAQALARRLTDPVSALNNDDLSTSALAVLSSELLPDWDDDWVISEAEDWRQQRVNALEAMADHLITRERLAEAALAARAAMKVDPLRESAHAWLIRVHLAKGNQSEALRVYDRYTELLRTVLGLEPTPMITALVEDILH